MRSVCPNPARASSTPTIAGCPKRSGPSTGVFRRTRISSPSGLERLRARLRGAVGAFAIDAQQVVNVADAGHTLGDVLGDALLTALAHAALERDLAVVDAHVDVGGVHVTVLCEAIANVLTNALVRSLVAARAAPGVGTLRPLRSPRRRIAPARPLDVALPTLATVAHVARPRRADVALRRTRVLGLAETAGVAIVPIVAHALGARAPARAIRSAPAALVTRAPPRRPLLAEPPASLRAGAIPEAALVLASMARRLIPVVSAVIVVAVAIAPFVFAIVHGLPSVIGGPLRLPPNPLIHVAVCRAEQRVCRRLVLRGTPR